MPGSSRPSRPPKWAEALLSIGVTGTNGKTTVTRLIARGLDADFGPCLSSTTLGYRLGGRDLDAPARSFRGLCQAARICLNRGGRALVLEMTSKALAAGFAIAWPVDIAVFTNLSDEHLCDHGSYEHYLASKAQLFVHLRRGGAAVLNAADPASAYLAEVLGDNPRVLYYACESRGTWSGEVDLEARSLGCELDGTRFRLTGRRVGQARWIKVAGHGSVFVENYLAALSALLHAGVELDVGIERLRQLNAPRGRFQIIHRKPTVVVDYAHTPDALERCVATARKLCERGGRLHLVFGAGGGRDRGKRAAMAEAASSADRVWITNDNPRYEDPASIAAELAAGLRAAKNESSAAVQWTIQLDRKAAMIEALTELSEGDVVVAAGRGHETEQEIAGQRRRFDDAEVLRGLLAQGKSPVHPYCTKRDSHRAARSQA